MCSRANNNLHFIDPFARRITTRNGRCPRESTDFSSLHHIVIARESTMKHLSRRYFSQTCSRHQPLTFPNPQAEREERRARGGIEEVRVAPFTREPARWASSAGFYKRLHLHVATNSSSCHCRDIIVSRGYCHRQHVRACSGREENVGHLPRRMPLIRNGRTYRPSHYLPARRTRTEIIDKRILACIEMQKGYSLTSFVFLHPACTTTCAHKHGERYLHSVISLITSVYAE